MPAFVAYKRSHGLAVTAVALVDAMPLPPLLVEVAPVVLAGRVGARRKEGGRRGYPNTVYKNRGNMSVSAGDDG